VSGSAWQRHPDGDEAEDAKDGPEREEGEGPGEAEDAVDPEGDQDDERVHRVEGRACPEGWG